MRIRRSARGIAATLLVVACPAWAGWPGLRAAPLTFQTTVFGFANGTEPGTAPPPLTVALPDLPASAAGDGTLRLTTFGDFSFLDEWIDVRIEGVFYGRLWDWNPVNDLFDGVTEDNDIGQEYGTLGDNAAATLTIPEAQLDTFLTDRVVEVELIFAPGVDDLSDGFNAQEFITARLSFETALSENPDVNGDGAVDLLDVETLIASYGPDDGCGCDFNDDGWIDRDDLDILISAGFQTVPGDTDLDGDVDGFDFNDFAIGFGFTTPPATLGPAATVPEPAGGLLLLFSVGLKRSRRCRHVV